MTIRFKFEIGQEVFYEGRWHGTKIEMRSAKVSSVSFNGICNTYYLDEGWQGGRQVDFGSGAITEEHLSGSAAEFMEYAQERLTKNIDKLTEIIGKKPLTLSETQKTLEVCQAKLKSLKEVSK